MNKNNKSKIVRKTLARTLNIQIITMLIGILGMVVDGAVTGSLLSVDHMAAYGLVLPILTIFAAATTMVEVGISTCLGRMMGKGDKEGANKVISSCFVAAISLSIIFVLVIEIFAPQIASLLGPDNEIIINHIVDYLRGYGFVAPAMFVMMAMFPILHLNGDGKRLIIAVFAMTVINIIGDLLNGYIFHQGLLGMALATTISYYVALIVVISHFFKKNKTITLSIKGVNFVYIGDMFIYGFPPTLQQICKSVLIICINKLILKVSDTDSVAIYSALMSAANICMVIGSAVGTSASIIGAVYDGQRNLRSHKTLLKNALAITVLLNAILTLAVILGAKLLMPMFLNSGTPELKLQAARAFRIYATNTVFYSINVLIRSYLESTKKIVHSYIYSVLNTFLLTFLYALILSKFFNVDGIWISYTCGEITSTILYILFALCSSRNKNFFERIMLVSKHYFDGIIAQDYFYITSNTEEITGKLDFIDKFINENGGTKEQIEVARLCSEEIINNVLTNGFKKDNSLEVSLSKLNDGFSLSFTDDCMLFNPLKQVEQQQDDSEETKRPGLIITASIPHDVKYLSVLNLNTLVVKI